MSTLTFMLSAQKRAVKRVSRTSDWEPDEEGFAKRWPNGKGPDIGIQRSTDYQPLALEAARMNESQLAADFLDWLFVVDVDAPLGKTRR